MFRMTVVLSPTQCTHTSHSLTHSLPGAATHAGSWPTQEAASNHLYLWPWPFSYWLPTSVHPSSLHLRFGLYLLRVYMIYLLTAIGLSPGGNSTVHIYTQTIHRTTQNKQYIEQHNNWEECGACPVLARFTLASALQLRKMHGQTSVRVAASRNT